MRRSLVLVIVLGLAACSGRSERHTILPPLPSSIPRAETTIPSPVAGCQLASPEPGAEVQLVQADSAAEGVLEVGDVITAFNGRRIDSSGSLVIEVRSAEPSQQVSLTVQRGGEELTLEVTLGESTEVAGRPLLGVEVVTPIVTYTPSNLPVSENLVLGSFVRGIALEGTLYLLDPVPGRWQPYAEAPPTPWAAIRNGIYTIRSSGAEAIVDLVGTDFSQPLAPSQWTSPLLVSSISELGIAIASSQEGAAVLAIDPQAGTIAWTWPDPLSEDLTPLYAFGSPSADRIAVLVGDPDTRAATAHVILDRGGQEVTGWPDQGRFLPPGSLVIGWFDPESLLYAVPPGPGLFTFEIETRESAPLTLPAELAPGTVLWAVGDGRHVIALTEDGLLLLDTLGGEVRPLASGCTVTGVGDAGSLTG